MSTFVRSQASSITSAFFDFLTTIVCKEFFYFWNVFAGLPGTLVSSVTNFALGRIRSSKEERKDAITSVEICTEMEWQFSTINIRRNLLLNII